MHSLTIALIVMTVGGLGLVIGHTEVWGVGIPIVIGLGLFAGLSNEYY